MYSTGDLAREARTTLRGIRLLEAMNLFGQVPRNDLGERVFDESHVQRAKVISAAQMAGMSIREIKGAPPREIRENIREAYNFMAETASGIKVEGFDL